MNIDISWKLASKGGKSDPRIGVTSSSEGTDIAFQMIQNRYSGMKISIKYFYRKCGTERPDIITLSLSIYCKWLNRKERKLVQYTSLNFYKGNQQISFEVYKFIVNKLFDIENNEQIIVNLYFCIILVSLAWYFLSVSVLFLN